jgi:hypothetical protein
MPSSVYSEKSHGLARARTTAAARSARRRIESEPVGAPERIDYAAIRDRSLGTPAADVAQAALETAKRSDLLTDFCDARIGDLLEIGALLKILAPHREEAAGFIDAEAEVAKAPDEQQLARLLLAVAALFPFRALGLRHQPDPFVVPDRIDPTFRQSGEFPDAHGRPKRFHMETP